MGCDRERIKENARTHYELNKWNNALVTFISFMVNYAVNMLGGFAISIAVLVVDIMFMSAVNNTISPMEDEGFAAYEAVAVLSGAVSFVLLMVLSLVFSCMTTGVINMGQSVWFHKSIHQDKLGVGECFAPFKNGYKGNFMLMLRKYTFIMLWSLLFYIPGYIKTYEYSLAEYIKAENPQLDNKKVLEMSRTMTNGYKMDLFLLDLSFIGWFILTMFTGTILGYLYVFPYYYAAKAFAYEEIKASAILNGRVNEADFMSV